MLLVERMSAASVPRATFACPGPQEAPSLRAAGRTSPYPGGAGTGPSPSSSVDVRRDGEVAGLEVRVADLLRRLAQVGAGWLEHPGSPGVLGEAEHLDAAAQHRRGQAGADHALAVEVAEHRLEHRHGARVLPAVGEHPRPRGGALARERPRATGPRTARVPPRSARRPRRTARPTAARIPRRGACSRGRGRRRPSGPPRHPAGRTRWRRRCPGGPPRRASGGSASRTRAPRCRRLARSGAPPVSGGGRPRSGR